MFKGNYDIKKRKGKSYRDHPLKIAKLKLIQITTQMSYCMQTKHNEWNINYQHAIQSSNNGRAYTYTFK